MVAKPEYQILSIKTAFRTNRVSYRANNMHIAVCDDNIDELSRISSLLEDYSGERNRSITYDAFHSATELLETMRARRFDLLLLDIPLSFVYLGSLPLQEAVAERVQ
jgi:CheY-like chemotaxis protein